MGLVYLPKVYKLTWSFCYSTQNQIRTVFFSTDVSICSAVIPRWCGTFPFTSGACAAVLLKCTANVSVIPSREFIHGNDFQQMRIQDVVRHSKGIRKTLGNNVKSNFACFTFMITYDHILSLLQCEASQVASFA